LTSFRTTRFHGLIALHRPRHVQNLWAFAAFPAEAKESWMLVATPPAATPVAPKPPVAADAVTPYQ
jgi:hypothetical protein